MSSGYFTRTYEHWRATETENLYGETIKEWSKIADLKGRAYKKSIGYGFDSAQFYGELDWTFATYADAGLQNNDEIRFNDRRLTVRATAVTSRGDRLEAVCRERQ